MSWSVSSIGKASAVKADLVMKFENAKNNTKGIPAESEAVGIAEQLVNNQLDFLTSVNGGAVRVEASGSASTGGTNYSGSAQIKVEVQSIHGFVE